MNLVGYVHYQCRSCRLCCLNHHTESCTRYRECERCHSVWVPDRGEPVDELVDGLRWAAHAVIVESSILDDLGADDSSGEDDLDDDRRRSPGLAARSGGASAAGQSSLSDFAVRTDGGR